jgi:hypothetical protein
MVTLAYAVNAHLARRIEYLLKRAGVSAPNIEEAIKALLGKVTSSEALSIDIHSDC